MPFLTSTIPLPPSVTEPLTTVGERGPLPANGEARTAGQGIDPLPVVRLLTQDVHTWLKLPASLRQQAIGERVLENQVSARPLASQLSQERHACEAHHGSLAVNARLNYVGLNRCRRPCNATHPARGVVVDRHAGRRSMSWLQQQTFTPGDAPVSAVSDA